MASTREAGFFTLSIQALMVVVFNFFNWKINEVCSFAMIIWYH